MENPTVVEQLEMATTQSEPLPSSSTMVTKESMKKIDSGSKPLILFVNPYSMKSGMIDIQLASKNYDKEFQKSVPYQMGVFFPLLILLFPIVTLWICLITTLHCRLMPPKNIGASGPHVVLSKPVNAPELPFPRVAHLLAIKLRDQEAMETELIQIEPSKITTKQRLPATVFKCEDCKVKLAQMCRFTLIEKFDNNMPKMEVIRK